MNTIHATREQWLVESVKLIKEQLFDVHEYWLPPIIRISVGLCGGKAIGIYMDPEQAEDGSSHIFIDPRLKDPIQILATVVHELVHASVGVECKHKGMFVKVIRALGLEGKPTATVCNPGTELYATLTGMSVTLGDFPHATLERKKKETKKHPWISFISPNDEDFVIRANKNTVKEKGPPRDYNGEPMVPKDPADMEDDEDDSESEDQG